MPIELLCLYSSYINPLLSPCNYSFQRVVHEVLPEVELAKVVNLVQRLYLLDYHGTGRHRILTLGKVAIKLTPIVEDKVIN